MGTRCARSPGFVLVLRSTAPSAALAPARLAAHPWSGVAQDAAQAVLLFWLGIVKLSTLWQR